MHHLTLNIKNILFLYSTYMLHMFIHVLVWFLFLVLWNYVTTLCTAEDIKAKTKSFKHQIKEEDTTHKKAEGHDNNTLSLSDNSDEFLLYSRCERKHIFSLRNHFIYVFLLVCKQTYILILYTHCKATFNEIQSLPHQMIKVFPTDFITKEGFLCLCHRKKTDTISSITIPTHAGFAFREPNLEAI